MIPYICKYVGIDTQASSQVLAWQTRLGARRCQRSSEQQAPVHSGSKVNVTPLLPNRFEIQTAINLVDQDANLIRKLILNYKFILEENCNAQEIVFVNRIWIFCVYNVRDESRIDLSTQSLKLDSYDACYIENRGPLKANPRYLYGQSRTMVATF